MATDNTHPCLEQSGVNYSAGPAAPDWAIILSGGLGTRLRQLVADRPKPMASVGGKPFLAYLLEQLATWGLAHVVLATGYRSEQIHEYFGDQYLDLVLRYSREKQPLGTGGALRMAYDLCPREDAVIMNGDSHVGVDLQAMWRWHRDRQAAMTMALTRVDDVSHYGAVETDRRGALRSFVEKGRAKGAGWINAGVYLVTPDFVLSIPRHAAVSLERDVFPRWLGRGLFGFKQEMPFIDIGTPEAYRQAARYLATTAGLLMAGEVNHELCG